MSNLMMDYGSKTMKSKEVHQVINYPVDDNVELTMSNSVIATQNYDVQRKKSDEQMSESDGAERWNNQGDLTRERSNHGDWMKVRNDHGD